MSQEQKLRNPDGQTDLEDAIDQASLDDSEQSPAPDPVSGQADPVEPVASRGPQGNDLPVPEDLSEAAYETETGARAHKKDPDNWVYLDRDFQNNGRL